MHIEWSVDYGRTFNGISQGGHRNARHVPIIYERAMWAAGHLQWKHCLVRADRTGTLVLFHGALVLAHVCQPIWLLPVRAMLVCFLVVLSHTSIHSFFFLPLFSWQRTPNTLESGTFVKTARMPSGTAAAKGFGDFHRVALLVTAPKTGFTQVRSWANLLTTATHGTWNTVDTFSQNPLILLFHQLTYNWKTIF